MTEQQKTLLWESGSSAAPLPPLVDLSGVTQEEQPLVRRRFDPLRREIVGQAQGVVLEVGAGGGQNFPFYDPIHVVRVEAVEPDEVMLDKARRRLTATPVPFALTHAPVETLPFPDAHFESAVATLALCSVHDPERGLRETSRVLKPGGTLQRLEHVRAQGRVTAWVQDALVPLSTRCMGNCHWNRDTLRIVLHTGFQTTQVRQLSGGLQPMLLVYAIRPQTPEEADEGQ
jgi:ubiquinone/menaquinone biosynthesis C-methylase UbiE